MIAYVLGAGNIGGLSAEMGKMILEVFLVIAVVSFLVSLVTGRKPNSLI